MIKTTAILLSSLFALPATAATLELKYNAACVFEAVATRMKIVPRTDLELPKVSLASQTELKDFQDVIAVEWSGYRPEVITNVYAPKANRIFLTDEESAYSNGRFLEDSLAHELAHYVQVVYRGESAGDDDRLEMDAVQVQTWIRETYFKKGLSPCEPLQDQPGS